jgi:tripartite ATP-independent transporter DctM subunit
MSIPFIVLAVSFVLLLILNVPVAFSIGIATLLAILAIGDMPAFALEAHRIATGIESFTLLAIPFFILSGLLMGQGGIAQRLIDFANGAVGGFRGGLSQVNVGTCMMFGSISGSATAAVSAIGSFMIPAMTEKGYDRDFSTSITITSATTGLLIPPSNVMIVYSLATGGSVSVVAIFAAGILPGILMGVALMITAGIISIRRNYGRSEGVSFSQTMVRFVKAAPALLLIVIVLGGILGGIFTATEASAIAVVYALFLGMFVYRELKLKHLPRLFLQAGVMTSVVMLLIGTSMAMSWVLAYEQVPQDISAALLSLTDNPYLILLIITLILLGVGVFMDMTPAVLIFTPIFLPVVQDFGIDPVHFGIVMIMNLCIGLCTPPVGTALFLGCGIGKTTVSNVIKPLIPFFLTMIVVLLLTIYVESISMFLPNLFGF